MALKTIDKVLLNSSVSLSVETGFNLGWSPGAADYITGLKGWFGSAPIRRSKSDLLGGHGSHSERGFKDERLIMLSGHSVRDSRADAAAFVDQLAGFLGDGTEGIFQVEDLNQGTRWAEVYLASGGVDLTWTGGVDVSYSIYMLAPDPRKYGSRIVAPSVGIPQPGSGLKFPLFRSPATGKLDLGRGAESGRISLTNAGTADTGPVFTIYGDHVPGFTITEINSGRRLVYSDTLQQNQTLTLDTNSGAVILDGYAPRSGNLTVREWTRVGPNESATWLFESPGSDNARMEVEVYPAWW